MDLELLLRRLIRGRLAISLTLILAPVAGLAVLGSFWLGEHELLLPFLLTFAGVYGAWRLILWALQRRALARPAPEIRPIVQGNPEWTEVERAAFGRLCSGIAVRVAVPLPWPALQTEAMRLLERAAAELSGGKRGPLDFSIPEAMLLADRVLGRLRGDLRHYVPLADQVRIGTLIWLCVNRRSKLTLIGIQF